MVVAFADRVVLDDAHGHQKRVSNRHATSFCITIFPYSSIPVSDFVQVLCARRAVVRSLSNNYDQETRHGGRAILGQTQKIDRQHHIRVSISCTLDRVQNSRTTAMDGQSRQGRRTSIRGFQPTSRQRRKEPNRCHRTPSDFGWKNLFKCSLYNQPDGKMVEHDQVQKIVCFETKARR